MSPYTASEVSRLLRTLSSANLRFAAALARSMKLTLSEIAAIEHLDASGQLTASQLAERLHLTSGAVTGLVDRLEGMGYLMRNPNPSDRRSWLLTVTEQAREEVLRHERPFIDQIRGTVNALPGEHREVVGRFLREVTDAMEEHAARPRESRHRP